MKKRLDHLLVEKLLAPTRARAQSLIMNAQALVNDQPVLKPGALVSETAELRIRGKDHPYVSRGGLKLEAALEQFQIVTQDKVGLDIGASTGGFTHCLLLRGVSKVIAIDVGSQQMAWSLRADPRVVVKEGINARYLEFAQVGETVGIIVIDVAFISLEKILGPLLPFATPDTDWVTLIKPQFEVGVKKLPKGGVVKSREDQTQVVEKVRRFGESIGLRWLGVMESPIQGAQGNREFLAHWRLSGSLEESLP